MKIDLSQFRNTFMQESSEHLTSMEADLLVLRDAPGDSELLNSIFRAAHSIKGGAGSFGLTNVVRFTHTLENLLDCLRSLEMPVTELIVSLLLRSADILQGLLKLGNGEEMPADAVDLLEQLEMQQSAGSAIAASEPVPEQTKASGSTAYRIEFIPSHDLIQSGSNPILLLRNLGSLGAVEACRLHTDELPPLAELDPSHFHLSWTIEMTSERSEAEIREVFEFVEHLAEICVHVITPGMPLEVVDAVMASSQEVGLSAAQRPEAQRVAVARSAVDRRQHPPASETSSMRVSTEKVDRLIDLVGELVIAHVMTKQLTEAFTPEALPKLREAVGSMERNIRELHERMMGVRMIPVGTLFQRFKRTVFDIAQSTGKQIRLETSGNETEIDKSLLELLGDSMIHLVRNAADHGIESAEERAQTGKPVEGTIRLSACHRAGKMLITISDDGAGIDPVRVQAKAIERGLITPEARLTDDQIKMLIFEPGFSTRDQVSDLSGRGVGMDVVKRNVQKLSGMVMLSSEKGKGSTVSIELPLTLAIMEGLLVRVDDRTLVLPLLSVVEAVRPTPSQIVRIAEQGEVLNLRQESVPILRVRRFLGSDGSACVGKNEPVTGAAPPSTQVVIVVEAGNKKIGLLVDGIAGQQQVVLKSLESHFHKVDGLMGVTILGDGCVAPVVDVSGISEMNLFSLKRAAERTISPAEQSTFGKPVTC